MCGTASWEWDPRTNGALDAYVPMWHDCMGCKHKAAFQTSEGEQNIAGRSVVLKSREVADRIRLNPASMPGPPRIERRTRAKRGGPSLSPQQKPSAGTGSGTQSASPPSGRRTTRHIETN